MRSLRCSAACTMPAAPTTAGSPRRHSAGCRSRAGWPASCGWPRRAAADAIEHDRETVNWSEWSLAAAVAAGVAMAAGDFGRAERTAAEAELLYRRSAHGFVPVLLYPALSCVRALRGDIDAAHEALDSWEATGVWGAELYRALVDGFDGEPVAADDVLAMVGSSQDLLGLTLAALAVELGDVTDDVRLLAAGIGPIDEAVGRGIRWCPGWSFFLPRLRAVAAWRLGRGDAATLLEAACTTASRTRAHVELARARADHAASLAAGQPERAAALDTRARQVFAEHGLVALLRRRRDPTTGQWTGTGPAVTLADRTFFFSDVVDSTGLTERVGVEEYSASLLAAHNGIVRGCLRESNGIEFKHTGDGIAAWFPTPMEAVVAANDAQDRLARFNDHHAGEPLHVRIGIAVGDVIVDSDEQFQGLALVRARRLCDLARADQVVVADEVAVRAASDRFEFRSIGEVVLKGFRRGEIVHRLVRAPS